MPEEKKSWAAGTVVAHGCTWLHMVAHDCTWLHLVAHGCTGRTNVFEKCLVTIVQATCAMC